MIKEQEISGRELGIVRFDYQDNTKQEYIGAEAMLSLFPDAADSNNWSKVRSTSYFLDRPTLTMEDIYKLPQVLGAYRFAYPTQFPQEAGVVNPVY